MFHIWNCPGKAFAGFAMFLQFIFIFASFLTMFTSMKVLPMFLCTIFPSTVNFHFFKERKLLFACYFPWFSRSFCLLKCLLHFWQGLNLLWAWNFKCSIRPYWLLLQTFSQVIHLILLLWLSNIDLILAEYQFKLLKFLGSSVTFRIQKILLLCLTMCVSLLDWDLQSTKVQTKWLQIQTKTQAFGTVQLLEPWRKVRQLRPILVLSFLAECWINY